MYLLNSTQESLTHAEMLIYVIYKLTYQILYNTMLYWIYTYVNLTFFSLEAFFTLALITRVNVASIFTYLVIFTWWRWQAHCSGLQINIYELNQYNNIGVTHTHTHTHRQTDRQTDRHCACLYVYYACVFVYIP